MCRKLYKPNKFSQMKKPPFINRKLIHASLLVFIIIIQILIFRTWFNHNSSEKKLVEAISTISNPNLILTLSNKATNHYFDAQNHFNDYIYSYKKLSLENYKISIDSMTVCLDSLNTIARKEHNFKDIVSLKISTEKEIAYLKRALDSIMVLGIKPVDAIAFDNLSLKKYDFEKVLKSISFDSIKISDDVVKRGIFARIGNAIIGKYDVKREELHLNIKMTYGEEEKSGNIETQLKNAFLSTDRHYSNQFFKLQNRYADLTEKDRKLISINKKIIDSSQEIIQFYTDTAEKYSIHNQKNILDKYNLGTQIRNSNIATLLVLMGLATFLLLIFTGIAFFYEKKLSEAKLDAEKNLDFKNRLIGMISHEMRAPLKIISNYANKLKIENKNNELKPTINSLHFTSDSLLITANQILDFSKNEHKKIVAYNAKANLYEEINLVINSLQSLAENKNINIITDYNSNLNTNVLIDAGKLHQLFYNIIGNAIKFTDKGNITVLANTSRQESKINLEVTIIDTGIGIPEKDLKNIFDKFYQSESSGKQISFGAGLGLNLCKEIIELYEGEIYVESQLNIGTKISFFLCLDEFSISSESNHNKIINLLKNKSVLVAILDDDPIMIAILSKLLREADFDVKEFTTCNSLREFLKTGTTDLIITDLLLPDGSGIEFIDELKNTSESIKEIPFIALTGDNYMENVEPKDIGMNEIIIKPINKEELYAKLLKVLQ